jgi:DNA-binding MarR family transcriptional regulator
MKKTICTVAILAAMMMGAPRVYAQAPAPSGEAMAKHQLDDLAKRLSLTPAQVKTLTPVFTEHGKVLQQADTESRNHLRGELTKEQAKKLQDMESKHQPTGDLRKTLSLTPEQISKHDAFMKQISARMNNEQKHFLDSINKTLDAKQKAEFAKLTQPPPRRQAPPAPAPPQPPSPKK